MKTALEQLIEYSENILKHSTINAPLIIDKAKQLLAVEKKQIVDAKNDKLYHVETGGELYYSKTFSKD